jgi:acid phosphatase (class A)
LIPRRAGIAALVGALLCGSLAFWSLPRAPNYLAADTATFVAVFSPPPAEDSPRTRSELDELLALQSARTATAREAARADRKKDIRRFYAALGLDPTADASLAPLQILADRVEDDLGPYVRAAKHRFSRRRPYVIESRLEPCIGDVADDLSYPSGHATYGYVMGLMLADMVPERRAALLERAEIYARQRMVCGVHYASDIAAGRVGAEWLMRELYRVPEFRSAQARAAEALRAALRLPPRRPGD